MPARHRLWRLSLFVLGFYLLAPLTVIVVTGFFYTIVWGEAFHLVTSGGGGVATPPAPFEGPATASDARRPALSLDRIEALARRRHPGRNLSITLPLGPDRGAKVGAANDYNNSYGEYVSAQFELDRFDGALLKHETLAEDPRYWWHGWVYPLHVGSVLGPTTKVLWLIACLILVGLPVTGLWMWWERRPSGRTGFPRRPDRLLPPGLTALIAALAVLLPVVGASIVVILIGELLVGIPLRGRADRGSVRS